MRYPYDNAPPKEYITLDQSAIRELLNDAAAPGLGLSLAEALVEAGCATAAHYHDNFDEIYYCLEGDGVLHRDGTQHSFASGDYYLLPRGSTHFLEARTRLRLLCICSPGYTHDHTVLVRGEG